MKTITIILVFLLANTCHVDAQVNLVPNGDFEIYSTLPDYMGEVDRAVGWNNLNGYYNAGYYASPDYWHTSSWMSTYYGVLTPYSGNGQMAVLTHVDSYIWREYISTKLISPMIPGHKYKISLYLTNGIDNAQSEASNNFGINFSINPLFQASVEPIAVIPQIEIDTIIYFWGYWQHLSFNYTADNLYNYITIGNFKDDAHTLVSTFGTFAAYYFIDKVELFPVGLNIEGDSIICVGTIDTLKIQGDSIVKWANSLNPGTILATDSLITVSSTTTTTYLAYSTSDTASFTVHVVSSPVVNLGNDTSLCQGQTLILNATTPNATYLWQDNSHNSFLNVTQQGVYWVKVTDTNGCNSIDTIKINYKQLPIVNLGNDTTLCLGLSILLNATCQNATYLWQDNSTNPTFNVNHEGIYYVKVSIDSNCFAYDTLKISYRFCDTVQTIIPDIYIPNSFTPNGDGLNDVFNIKTLYEFSDYKLVIFDRWGEMIFESDDKNKGWNGTYKGKAVPLDVYIYQITATIKDTGEQKKITGRVTVVR